MTDIQTNPTSPQIIIEPIKSIMEQSYIDYSMSVITGRALPDVRDGLKPVHRRILYAMHEAGNYHNRAYKKSARMVGDVIGKYHPHGDVSVYDAAVRMAQPFSMFSPLIDGQGNFGSIDGDSPAAMRYTEMRLAKITAEFFHDLDKETIEWTPNYDGSEKEPSVLTTPYPNLLVNGGDGIAVGMASSIPPHNLGAVVETTLHLMNAPEATTAEIVGLLEAPDFPTGAMVHGLDGFADAVESGRGRLKLRSVWHEEDRPRGGKAIVIDELPYQVNKANLVAKISELVREKKIDGIVDLRDESNKDGLRIWIGLRADESPEIVFADLASQTDIETTVSYNCVVLDKGIPKQLGLKTMILKWIEFRHEVVLARFVFERKQAIARLHILEGYMKALGMLDQVIALIRGAESPAAAKNGLMALLEIDDAQAQSILDLRLQKLTGMEIESIRAEHAQFVAKVAELTQIIETPEMIRDVMREELRDIASRYATARRTEIGANIGEITREDLIPREDVLISMTRGGYVMRLPANALARQNRGTRGKKAMAIGEDDSISFMKQAHSHDTLMAFTRSGQVYAIKAYRIPEGSLSTKGRHIRNVIDGLDEEITSVMALPEHDPALTILTVTQSGQVKRSAIEDYAGATRRGGIRGVGLEEKDFLVASFAVRDEDHLMLISSSGKSIRFEAREARVMGRGASGVRGMKLEDGDRIVGAAVIPGGQPEGLYLMCVGENGVGKRTGIAEFSLQGRAGAGMIAFNATAKTGSLVAAMVVTEGQDLVMFSSNGVSNRISIPEIRETGRATSGVHLMNLDEGCKLVSVTAAVRLEDKEDVQLEIPG